MWLEVGRSGQKQTFLLSVPMSALLPKADIGERNWDVRFVPLADMTADLRTHGDLQDLREIGLTSA
jgi:hypothetical protein